MKEKTLAILNAMFERTKAFEADNYGFPQTENSKRINMIYTVRTH